MTVKTFVLNISPGPVRRALARIEASPLGYRLARGAFWTLAGAVISRGLALISSIIIARLLGKEGFGQLGVIQGTVGMFGTFAGFGLGMTATKYVAEFRKSDPARAGRIISLSRRVAAITGSVMAVTLIVMAPWLATHTLAAPELGPILRIVAAMLFLSALTGAQSGALAGFEAFKSIAKVTLATGVLSFPLMVAGVYFGGLEGAAWALVACSAANWLLNYLVLRRETIAAGVPLRVSPSREDWKVLWSFSIPATLGGILVGPTNWVCSAILVNQPNGYAEMGLFNAASQWRTAVLFLPAAVGGIVLPILSNLRGDGDHRRYKKVLWLNVLLNGGVATLVAILAIALARPIMASYGKGFEDGALVLMVLVASAVLASVNSVVGQAIASANKMWLGLVFNSLWASVVVITTATLAPHFGSLGLALAICAGYAVLSGSTSLYVIRTGLGATSTCENCLRTTR